MFKFSWWRDENNREAAKTITDILKVAVPAIVVCAVAVAGWFGWQSSKAKDPAVPTIQTGDNSPVQTGNGKQIVAGDNATIVIGFSEDMFKEMLAQREQEIRTKLADENAADRQTLLNKLGEVERQKSKIDKAYAETV